MQENLNNETKPKKIKLDFKDSQTLHLDIFLQTSAKFFARGLINSSLLLLNCKTILFADFGPNPGSLDINLINSSISDIFCI